MGISVQEALREVALKTPGLETVARNLIPHTRGYGYEVSNVFINRKVRLIVKRLHDEFVRNNP